ncbi:MAG: glycosyltransferase family 39 protein [Bacteroidia bacterium]|nr:glycosyltransferase family 39 protein [Bacteroidia bacterium]
MSKENNNSYWVLLGMILLIAGFLRFIGLGSIPLFNDELSALSRLSYGSIGELVEMGIKPDGHPAGVQLFLYTWEKVAGSDPFWLRLPFVLLSMGAVWLFFQIINNFFHRTAALIATSFFASIQYGLYFGILIRPYAPGQFFVLLMAWAVQKIWLKGGDKVSVYWMVFVLAGVLAAYTHYFAGLGALVLGLLALVFFPKRQKKMIMFGGLVAGILYLPHISIFLAQIEKGGIGGWLAAPGLDFFRSYAGYILHHSWKLGLFVLFLWMIGVSQKIPVDSSQRRFRRFAGMAFLLPFLVGILYSHTINPVFHEGSAYFAFPFLIIFMSSFIPKLTAKWERNWVLAMLVISIGSLVLERKHFELSTERGMKKVLEVHKKWELEQFSGSESETPLFLSSNDASYAGFYPDSKPANLISSLGSYGQFREGLRSMDQSEIALGWVSKPIDLYYMAIAREHFPYIKVKEEFFVSEYYGLSREAAGLENINSPKAFELPLSEHPNRTDTSFLGRQHTINIGEYSPAIELVMDSLDFNWNHGQLWASAEIFTHEASTAKLLLSFQIEDSVLHQESISVEAFRTESQTWNWAYNIVRLKHGPFKKSFPEQLKLKVYVWNPDKNSLILSQLRLEYWEGNNRLYGLFEPVTN